MTSQRQARTERNGSPAGSGVASPAVELQTLGHLRLVLQGTDETPKLGPKHLALLVYLFHERRPLHPTDVIELLGHGQDEETERAALQRTVGWLRKCIPVINIRLSAETIEAIGGLRLDTEDVDSAIDAGDARFVADRYHGEFLEGFVSGSPGFDEWAQRERGRLKRAWTQAILASARKAERKGRWADAAIWWQILVERAPMRHELVAGLMRAHIKAHQVDRAGQAYAEYCARLEQHGIARPASSVQRLVAENPAITRIGTATVETAPAPETPPVASTPGLGAGDAEGNGASTPMAVKPERPKRELPDFDLIEDGFGAQSFRESPAASEETGLLGLWEQFGETGEVRAGIYHEPPKPNGGKQRPKGSRLEFFLPDGGTEIAEETDLDPYRPVSRRKRKLDLEGTEERFKNDRYTRVAHSVTSVRKPWGPYLRKTWDEFEPLREYLAEVSLEVLRWLGRALAVTLMGAGRGLLSVARGIGRGFRAVGRALCAGVAGGFAGAGRGAGILGRGAGHLLVAPFRVLAWLLVALPRRLMVRKKGREPRAVHGRITVQPAAKSASRVVPRGPVSHSEIPPRTREEDVDTPRLTGDAPPPLSSERQERLFGLAFEEFGGAPEIEEDVGSTTPSGRASRAREQNGSGRIETAPAGAVFGSGTRSALGTGVGTLGRVSRTRVAFQASLLAALKAVQRRWYAPVGLGAGGLAVVLALMLTGVIGGIDEEIPGKLTTSLPKVTLPKVTVPKVTVKTPAFIENPLSSVGDLFSGSILKRNGEWIVLADVNVRGSEESGDLAVAAGVALEAYLAEARFFSVMPRERALSAFGKINGTTPESLGFETALKVASGHRLPVVISAAITRGGKGADSVALRVHSAGGKELYQVRAAVEKEMTPVEALVGLAGPLRRRLGEPSEEIEASSSPARLLSESVEALAAYGRARRHLFEGRYPAAIAAGQEATSHDSAFALAYRITAEALALNGKRSAARSALERAWELSETISERERLRLLADRLAWDGSDEDAALTYDRLFQLYRDDVGALRGLAVLQRKIGARGGGEGNLRVAYTIDPFDWPALARLARYLGYSGTLPDVDSLVASLGPTP